MLITRAELVNDILNRRSVGRAQLQRLRAAACASFALLLDLAQEDGLAENKAVNAIICLQMLLRTHGVSDEQRRRFAMTLVRLGRVGRPRVRERALVLASTTVEVDRLLRTPMFDREVISQLADLIQTHESENE
jgi:hypothetical protein